MATGSGVDQRAAAGTSWSPASWAAAPRSAPVGQASSGSRHQRCSASCGGDALEPSVNSYSAGIIACETYKDVTAGSNAAQRAAVGTCWIPAASATAQGSPRCDTAKLWQQALMLLSELRREEVGSQRHGLQRWGACSACETCEQWQLARALLSELRQVHSGVQSHQLQRWDHRLRERRAVAAGPDAVQRAAAGTR